MADRSDKTEAATQAHREKQRREGMVARSADVGATAVLAAGIGLIVLGMPWVVEMIGGATRSCLAMAGQVEPTPAAIADAARPLGVAFLLLMTPLLGTVLVVGAGVSLAQVGLVLSPAALRPRASRLNPATGLKRVWFSSQTVFRFVKSLVLLAVSLAVAVVTLRAEIREVVLVGGAGVETIGALAGRLCLRVSGFVLLLLVLTAAADLAFTHWQHARDIRMSPDDLKEEQKEQQGDPETRRARRRLQRKIAGNAVAGARRADFAVTSSSRILMTLEQIMAARREGKDQQ